MSRCPPPSAAAHGPPPFPPRWYQSQIKDPWGSNAERESFDELANLYALFHECEHLEKAKMRVRDLDDAEYQRRMESLSRTFDMASRVLTSRGPSELDSFMAKYNIHATCPRAVIRLIKGDVDVGPSTAGGGGVSAAVASNITHFMISLLDLLELELTATDEVLPVLKDLQKEVNKLVRVARETLSWLCCHDLRACCDG